MNDTNDSSAPGHPAVFSSKVRSACARIVRGLVQGDKHLRAIFPVSSTTYARAVWVMHPDTFKDYVRDPASLDGDSVAIRIVGVPVVPSDRVSRDELQLCVTATIPLNLSQQDNTHDLPPN